MSLDLSALGRQVRHMSEALAVAGESAASRINRVRDRYHASAGNEDAWAQAVNLSRETAAWLFARPVEPFDSVRDLPAIPPVYQLVATDGSQIDLDRHGNAAYYVINIGKVFLRYGHKPTARLTSTPELYYRDEDLYLSDGIRRIEISGNYLSARRDVEEGVALAVLADEHLTDDIPGLALQDGTLVRWSLAGAERFVQERFLARYLSYLEALRERNIPVASYISRPRSPEVIGTIRLMFCPDVDLKAGRGAKCSACSDIAAGRDPSCRVCDNLVDADVLSAQLQEGQRGPIFLSMSKINIEAYGKHQIHFFYMRIGRELARIEIPQWVAEQPELVDRVHALVYDQAARGEGYPVALSRAHEQAVVRSADRRALQRMLAGSFVRADAGVNTSAKSASKDFSRG